MSNELTGSWESYHDWEWKRLLDWGRDQPHGSDIIAINKCQVCVELWLYRASYKRKSVNAFGEVIEVYMYISLEENAGELEVDCVYHSESDDVKNFC